MAGRIVEEKQCLCVPVCDPIKDIDGVVYLGKEVVSSKPTIPVLPRPEDQPGFTVKE